MLISIIIIVVVVVIEKSTEGLEKITWSVKYLSTGSIPGHR